MITYIIDALIYCFGYRKIEEDKPKLDFHDILYHIEQLPKDKILKVSNFLASKNSLCC